MKRIRFVLGLFIGVLLVVALAFPAAVLAEESAAATEAEASVTEATIETATAAEAETTAEQVADESAAEIDTSPGEIAPEAPAEEEADPGTGETTPESPAEEEADPGTGETTPESNGTAIAGLISTVEGLNLKQGIENSLDSKLQNAKDSLTAANAGLREDAVNKLQAFINACEAQRDKALTPGQADELIEMANNIILSL